MLDFKKRNHKATCIMIVVALLNIALFGIKLWIGLVANNIAILTDAINNLGDIIISLVSVFCFVVLNKKMQTFPYGLGRLEQIVSLLMSILIIFIGGYFFICALNRLFATLVLFKWMYFHIMLSTVFIKLFLAFLLKKSNQNLHSDIIKCATYDSLLDACITFMTVIGLLLTKYIQLRFDAFFGIIISILMIIEGIKICTESAKKIIGRQADKALCDEIKKICLHHQEITNVEIIEYHEYGKTFREFIVKAIFTNQIENGMIENVIQTINKESNEKFLCKILFIL